MKKNLKFIGVFLLVVFSFVLGNIIGNKDDMSTKIYINGQEVEVVDFMYTYKNEEGVVVEGDYSLVSDKGYEYSTDYTYDKEYTNATITKEGK